MDQHTACACGVRGKVVGMAGRKVIFWKRTDGVWWRDEAPDAGPLCGFCGVPSKTLLWNGWATQKQEG